RLDSDETDLIDSGFTLVDDGVADVRDLAAVGRERGRRVGALDLRGQCLTYPAADVEQIEMGARVRGQVAAPVLLESKSVEDEGLGYLRILGRVHDQHHTPSVG